MEFLYEIRIHARAGQGAETTAQLIAETAFRCGRFVQAFPSYGPERTGAPMQTFVRISRAPIRIHSLVYHPDLVMVMDASLFKSESIAAGLKDRSWLVANDKRLPSELKTWLGFKGRLATIDASPLAQAALGKNLPNMAVLAAAVRAVNFVDANTLKQVVGEFFTKKYHEEIGRKNMALMTEAEKKIKY